MNDLTLNEKLTIALVKLFTVYRNAKISSDRKYDGKDYFASNCTIDWSQPSSADFALGAWSEQFMMNLRVFNDLLETKFGVKFNQRCLLLCLLKGVNRLYETGVFKEDRYDPRETDNELIAAFAKMFGLYEGITTYRLSNKRR